MIVRFKVSYKSSSPSEDNFNVSEIVFFKDKTDFYQNNDIFDINNSKTYSKFLYFTNTVYDSRNKTSSCYYAFDLNDPIGSNYTIWFLKSNEYKKSIRIQKIQRLI